MLSDLREKAGGFPEPYREWALELCRQAEETAEMYAGKPAALRQIEFDLGMDLQGIASEIEIGGWNV